MKTALSLQFLRLVLGLSVLSFGSTSSAQQDATGADSRQGGYFYQPSITEAVGRAIRRQTEELEEKNRIDQAKVKAKNTELRRETATDGVIELTNRGEGTSRRRSSPALELRPTPVKSFDMKTLLEEAHLPLQEASSKNFKQPVRSKDSQPDDVGLDIALAALVALGGAFLGLSLWQRRQRSEP